MNPDRWRQVDGLVKAAVERSPAERDAFVRRECKGYQAVEQEVQSMLHRQDQSRSCLKTAAPEPEQPVAGQIVLHYRIIEKLGQGGMEVVYKAEDTRLNRSVALKFLSDRSSADCCSIVDADPHVPLLKQARAEFAKLQ